jgi:uncharacterized membrane protein
LYVWLPFSKATRQIEAMRKPQLILLGVGSIVVGMIPWLVFFGHGSFSSWHLTFQAVCHQRPERSLWFGGQQMIVCSRCAGLYGGMVLGVFLKIPAKWIVHARLFLFLCVAPALIDIITQDSGLHAPWHPSRLSTGFLIGIGGTTLAFSALREESRKLTLRKSNRDKTNKA